MHIHTVVTLPPWERYLNWVHDIAPSRRTFLLLPEITARRTLLPLQEITARRISHPQKNPASSQKR